MKQFTARVPSAKPITLNMINHSIVDAGASLRQLAKLAWNFDFSSLIMGDGDGALFTVYYLKKPLTIKVYRPRTGNGRFVRLTLDAELLRATSLSVGDVLIFNLELSGNVVLSVDRSLDISAPLAARRRTAQLPGFNLSTVFGFNSEGEIRRHETWERNRCSTAAEIVKQLEMQKVGQLRCHGCGNVAMKTYGVEVIEAHHRKPLSEYTEARVPEPKDFDLLCPSCHRAIHRLHPCDLATLKRTLRHPRR